MLFTPEIVSAFETIINAAENDFEMYRIKVLLRDLTAPPKPEQIDDKHQKFNDKIYVKARSGHYRASVQMHRDIWKYYHGEIPEGNFEIHHKDFNPENNSVENLILLSKEEHHRIHLTIEKSRMKRKTFVCEQCGRTYEAYNHGINRFCSKRCAGKKALTERLEERICAFCGKRFKVYKHYSTKCCSAKCRQRLTAELHSEWRECKWCGKKFKTLQSSRKQFCSYKCSNKFVAQTRNTENIPFFKPKNPIPNPATLD